MTQLSPETRNSLILRLPSFCDAAAGEELVSNYEPMVLRFAKRHGLQDADARELVQNVLLAVARAVPRWRPDPARGRFRTWLFRIARNQLLRMLSRRLTTTVGGSDEMSALCELASPTADQQVLEAEYRREIFRTAAAHVRTHFSPSTWDAFWKSCVEQQSVEEVTVTLGMTPGAVYVARCRVLHRLREVIRQWESDYES